MTALGRGGRRPDRLTAATAALVDAGVVMTRRPAWDAPTTYDLVVVAGGGTRWDVVPYELMRRLAAGECSPQVLRTWLHLDQAMGTAGWTADTVDELAARLGVTTRTVRSHVAALAALGTLVVTDLPGSGWMLSRPAEQMSVEDEDHASVDDAHLEERPARSGAASACGQSASRARAQEKSAGSDGKKVRGLFLAPEDLAPEDPSFELRSHRHLGEAARKLTNGRRRPKFTGRPARSGAISRLDVRQVLNQLGSDWVTGPQARWRNGLAGVIASHLDDGLPAAVIVRGIRDLADPDTFGGRVIPAARAGVTTIRTDVRLGLACPDCGCPDVDTRFGCPSCPPDPEHEPSADRTELTALPPLEERLPAYRELFSSWDQVAAIDPDAGEILRREGFGAQALQEQR